ncbi:hypothetical protein UlMin_032363 [Ulmus minor]
MESSARRRLDCLSRHLVLPQVFNHVLEPVFLSGQKSKHWEAEPVIIGGMVLDIHATPSIPANPRTTNPGKVNYALGGVARNVAECMSKLGTKPLMVSALGLDMAGNLLLENWRSAGLSVEGILRKQEIETPVVSNIFDVHGELAAGVASVEAIEKFLTPEWIRKFKYNVDSAPVLMVDANLNLPALEASCQMAAVSKIPVWFEPVSVAKSRRIVSIANYVSFASPNEDELIAMANALSGAEVFSYSPVESDNSRNKFSVACKFQMLKPAIWMLLEKGIKIVLVTLGRDGVFLCSKGGPSSMRIGHERIIQHASNGDLYETVTVGCPSNLIRGTTKSESSSLLFAVHFPALPASVVRVTGAGDCLVGGTLASICIGLDLLQSVAVGIAAAKATVEAETNVPHGFSVASIADDASLVYSAAKVICHEPMV